MEPRATIVTVLFTDWVNSTELIQRLGDEHAQRVFEDHRERLREAIAAHRGREVKWTGDGLMAVFPNSADGVRCAIAMQQQSGWRSVLAERLAVRIGLNVGEALPDEADYFGTPVVVARRLCDRAAGGQILCSSLIPGLLAGRQTFQFRACGDLVLKGITSPVAAHEVIYERAAPPTDTPFVGRLAELATLERSVQAAHSGVGGLVMLAGEAGIGKTRLVEEVAARARRSGARVLWGGCDEGAGSGAYGPFREALDGYVREAAPEALRHAFGAGAAVLARLMPRVRDVLPDLPEPEGLAPDEARTRLFDAVSQALIAIATAAPLLLVVDDLHWADVDTVALFRHLGRTVVRHRIVLLGTYRDAEVDDAKPLGQALAVLRRQSHFAQFTLKGLGAEEVEALLEVLAAQRGGRLEAAAVDPSLVDAVLANTRGNPFFVRSLVLHLVEEGAVRLEDGRWQAAVPIEQISVPEGIRQLLRQRLARLREATQQFLTVAAAVGESFRFDVVAAVAELGEVQGLAAVDEALQAQLIAPAAALDGYGFTHALVRQTLYEGLNPSRQVRTHRRIAEGMERIYGARASEHASEIAEHYHRSRTLPGAERGVPYCVSAAEKAERGAAFADAAAYLRTALDLLPASASERTRLLSRIGLMLAWALEFDQSRLVAHEAAARIAAEDGPAAAADYLAAVVVVLNDAGAHNYFGECPLVLQGLEYAGERRDTTWAILKALNIIDREAADPTSVGIALDTPERREVVAVFEHASDMAAQTAYTEPRPPARFEELSRQVMLGFVPWTSRAEIIARVSVPEYLFAVGDYRRGVVQFRAYAEHNEQLGRIAWSARAWAIAARFHIALGEIAAARQAREKAGSLAERLQGPSAATIDLVGAEDEWRMAVDDDWDRPLQNVGAGLGGQPIYASQNAATRVSIARAHARKGRVEAAIRRLGSVVPAIERGSDWMGTMTRIACDAAETLWLTQRTDWIDIIERNLREKVIAPDFRFPMMDGRLALARLCALQHRDDEAVEWFAAARTVLDEQGARPLRAITDYDEALMYARRGGPGDRERAQPLLNAALAQFHAIGMPGWIRRAEALHDQLSDAAVVAPT